MEMSAEEIVINGVNYVRADNVKESAKMKDGMPYVIARSYAAGVFAGYLEKREGKEVTLRNARRIWFWAGAASLSQLSQEGTKKPNDCKFPCEVDTVLLTEVCEILNVTEKARKSIQGVKIWEQ